MPTIQLDVEFETREELDSFIRTKIEANPDLKENATITLSESESKKFALDDSTMVHGVSVQVIKKEVEAVVEQKKKA